MPSIHLKLPSKIPPPAPPSPPNRQRTVPGSPIVSSPMPIAARTPVSSKPATPRASPTARSPPAPTSPFLVEDDIDDSPDARSIRQATAASSAAGPLVDTATDERQEQKVLFSSVRRNLGKYDPTLVLQNSGSVARDHLSCERTYLAYVRTSLTITSMGVALVQLFAIAATRNPSIHIYSRPLGGALIVLGFITLVIGVYRYFTIQRALIGGKFPAARISPTLISVALLSLTVVIFGILLGVRN